ncbi:MAG: hypothetical protein AAF368_08940, partial [Planctomycetota bacterium]
AYADGELSPEARAEFEARLGTEPRLAREVTELRRLHVLARTSAGPEPAEIEWERITSEPGHKNAHRLGWALLCVGGGGALLSGIAALWTSDLSMGLKGTVTALTAGFLLLFGTVLRARLRTMHLDPYRDLKR